MKRTSNYHDTLETPAGAQTIDVPVGQSQAGVDVDSERLQKQLQQLTSEAADLRQRLSQMQRLEDNRDLNERKQSAMGKSTSPSKAKSGYQIFHLVLVALIALIIGAALTVASAPAAPQPQQPDLAEVVETAEAAFEDL